MLPLLTLPSRLLSPTPQEPVDTLAPVGGALGDTAELMNALNADAFLAETSLPLPRLEMDDFLDSFLSADKAGGLGEGL